MLFHNCPINLEFSECMDDHPGCFWGLNTSVHVCEYVCLCVCVCVSSSLRVSSVFFRISFVSLLLWCLCLCLFSVSLSQCLFRFFIASLFISLPDLCRASTSLQSTFVSPLLFYLSGAIKPSSRFK